MKKILDSLVGKTFKEVKRIVDQKYKVRIVQEDGKDYSMTCDIRMDRINLSINKKVVTNAYFG